MLSSGLGRQSRVRHVALQLQVGGVHDDGAAGPGVRVDRGDEADRLDDLQGAGAGGQGIELSVLGARASGEGGGGDHLADDGVAVGHVDGDRVPATHLLGVVAATGVVAVVLGVVERVSP